MRLDIPFIVNIDIPEDEAQEFEDNLHRIVDLFTLQRDPNADVEIVGKLRVVS